jgi:NAD(P)-dependent dehydrogenase (short-subunit alcohol dehydrogenase family)
MLLALLLLPTMRASPSNPTRPIITLVASWSVYPAHLTMKAPKSAIGTSSYLKYMSSNKSGNGQQQQYGRSKLLCMYFMRELAARVPASRVILNSQDPGSAWTGITNSNKEALVQRFFMRITIEICARTLVNAVSRTDETHGQLMVDYDVVRYVHCLTGNKYCMDTFSDIGVLRWPKFMTKPKGVKLQQRIWEETRGVLEGYAPEVAVVYTSLGATEKALEK